MNKSGLIFSRCCDQSLLSLGWIHWYEAAKHRELYNDATMWPSLSESRGGGWSFSRGRKKRATTQSENSLNEKQTKNRVCRFSEMEISNWQSKAEAEAEVKAKSKPRFDPETVFILPPSCVIQSSSEWRNLRQKRRFESLLFNSALITLTCFVCAGVSKSLTVKSVRLVVALNVVGSQKSTGGFLNKTG